MRTFFKVLGWLFTIVGGLLILLGVLSWPPGGLMFALPFLLLFPGSLFFVFGILSLIFTRTKRSKLRDRDA